jgi:hypothetical protein
MHFNADDTKGLKSAIVDWITPQGQTLDPPISRKIKTVRGFHHERTGALLCPAGLNWASPAYVSTPHSTLSDTIAIDATQDQRKAS